MLVKPKTGLLLVLFLAGVIAAIYVYHICRNADWIILRFVQYQQASLFSGIINIAGTPVFAAIEFILLLVLFCYLLAGINKRRKISSELAMLTEHYCTAIEHFDITTYKKARESIKVIERYDILAKATGDTTWDWDIINDRILYNANLTKMLGYQNTEVINVVDWWKRNIHPEDFGPVSTSLSEVFEFKLETVQMEYRFRCTDGTYKDIYDRAFVTYDENKKVVRMTGAMQDVTHKKNEEREITKAILAAREQERCHIGLELHDNVNQILASTQLTLGMTKNKFIEREKMLVLIDTSKAYITHAIDELRKLSHELVPASFNDNSLKNVFESLLQEINCNNQFDINFHFDEIIHEAVAEDIQINLYRILQEQAKNTVKYSGATKIEIEVTLSDNVLRMRTFDNGKGFNPKYIKKGIGLSNMKKRVDAFSGKLMLSSSPGSGCEIIVEIPTDSN